MRISDLWLLRSSQLLAAAYAALLSVVLIYPFEFSTPFVYAENAADVRGSGVHFETPGVLRSTAPASNLHKSLTMGNGLTVAVWFVSQTIEQEELSRIFTYSLDPWQRNFAIGQDGPHLYVRIRLSEEGRRARTVIVRAKNVVRVGTKQFVAVAYDFKRLRIYVDGEERAAVDRPGTFLDWDPSAYLAVGNEVTGSRPWLGTVEAAAIFGVSLSETDIMTLFRRGLLPKTKLPANQVLAGFDFRNDANDKGLGEVVAAVLIPMMERPPYVSDESRQVYSWFRGANGTIQFTGKASLWDLIRNVILFIPCGVFAYSTFVEKSFSGGWAIIMALLLGGIVSAGFEGLQIFLAERTSSIFDVAANSVGALLGAVMAHRTSPGAVADVL